MLNHFKTHLLNKSSGFFETSLFPVAVDEKFTPVKQGPKFVMDISRLLFGADPDASLMDYRFIQFLSIIRGCHLDAHLHRFDSRETYSLYRQENYTEESLFTSLISPETGLFLADYSEPGREFLRYLFSVDNTEDYGNSITISTDNDRSAILRINRAAGVSANMYYWPETGLQIYAPQEGRWVVDYRKKPARDITEIINGVLGLPPDTFSALFKYIYDIAPEYQEGFYTITDSLSKFCMILFAVAIANGKANNDFEFRDKLPTA